MMAMPAPHGLSSPAYVLSFSDILGRRWFPDPSPPGGSLKFVNVLLTT